MAKLTGALFSPDMKYRYKLWRIWLPQAARKPVLIIGVNPSTATDYKDDPTIRRCITFAARWGYSGLYMGNLFGIVGADPICLKESNSLEHEIKANDNALLEMAKLSDAVVCAWGTLGTPYQERIKHLRELLPKPLLCMGNNQDGSPKHPLYLKRDIRCMPWIWREL